MATVVLSLALAACNNSSSPSPSASAAASTTAGGGGEVTTIVISGSSFGSDLTLPAGTVIEFANHDGFAHTATEGQNGVADANARFDFSLADGETSDQVTLEAGVYHVTCKIHHSMNLTITVS
jgi:plastocyanin